MKYFIGLFILLLFFNPSISSALRCGSDLVLKGERKIEVLVACGEPEFIEKWEEEIVTHVTGEHDEISGDLLIGKRSAIGKSRIVHVEEWTYNFGARSFIQYLTFLNGKLKKIQDGPRGTDRVTLSGSSKPRCGQLVENGDRKIEVIINCGDPYTIDYYSEEQFSSVSSAVKIRKIPQFIRDGRRYIKDHRLIRERIYEQKRKLINIEEWAYNFGPRQFMYFIKFENGRVIKVEEGDYGF